MKYEMSVTSSELNNYFHKIINKIYKLLPLREEKSDYVFLMQSVIIELTGINSLLHNNDVSLLEAIAKLEGLLIKNDNCDFLIYRKTIFECLNILGGAMKRCQDMKTLEQDC